MSSEFREPVTSSDSNGIERDRCRRHAFLITAHERPKQVQLLLDLIDHPLNDVFMALDAKGDVRDTDLHSTTSGLTFVPSGIMNWAAYSVVRADLDLLAAAVPGKYHYYHMITGSDLPLVSPEVLHQRLEASDTEYIQLEPERAAEARYKAAFRHPLVDLPTYRKHLAMRGSRYALVLLQKVLRLEKPSARGVQFHHASSYFSITHDFARYVVDQRPWIERTFKHGLACDEVFIPTVLMRSPFAAKVAEDRPGCPANLRCIDWSRRVHHSPHTFTEADIPMLREFSGTALFARKFNIELDPHVVAAVARWVGAPAGVDQPA